MSIKVLWVEDEPLSMKYEHVLARNEGWIITFADTVSKALELVRDKSFDLVVADLIMPNNDFEKKRGFTDPRAGIQLVNNIRDSGRKGNTPPNVTILVITAMSQEDGREVIDQLTTVRYFIHKPVEISEYSKIIKELTSKLESHPGHSN